MAKSKSPAAEGTRAPVFEAADQDGKPFSSTDLAGTPYVLFFYPKADTSGCTTETVGFRDAHARFRRAKVVLLGISPDPPKKQARFRDKHEVPFPLLCDTDHEVAEAFGCWVEKSMYGRTYMGIERSTFLVDGEGVVQRAWRKVKVAGHVEDVLAAAKSLS
jgi:peroxiredoxin